MSLQLEKLRLSTRQAWRPNTDENTGNWPQIFFWTEGLILLNWTEALMKRVGALQRYDQEEFRTGRATRAVRGLNPALFERWSPQLIFNYCHVWQSQNAAWTRLIIRARGERENKQGKPSEVMFGSVRLDERSYVLRRVATYQDVSIRGLAGLIHKAAKENDIRFFVRLGKALQRKTKPPEVNWDRVNPLAGFLVTNWCEGQDFKSRLPALCFFGDQALADFCSAAFGKAPGNPSSFAVRQWRKRLGLKQAKAPRVRETIVIKDEILLVGE